MTNRVRESAGSSTRDRRRAQQMGRRGRQDVAAVKRRADTTERCKAGLVEFPDALGRSSPRATPVISPLSGSTNHWSANFVAINRRSVPTPGSTTTR